MATSKVSPVGNNYYTTSVTENADGSLNSTTYRTDVNGENEVAVYTVSNATATSPGTKTFESGATDAEKEAFNNPQSAESQARSSQVKSLEPSDATSDQKSTYNNAAGKSNQASTTTDGNDDKKAEATDAQKDAAKEENDSFREGTRKEYGNAKYPLDLSSDHQDCIKFTILEYKPSLAQGKASENGRIVTVDSAGDPTIQGAGSISLGTITLPVPAGINDSNSVGWQSNEMNDLQKAAGQFAQNYALGGADAAKGAVDKAKKTLEKGVDDIKSGISGLIANVAANNNMIQQRTLGSMFNNNLELLFNGPGLRSFSFTFKLSPRNGKEAKEIMKIIRFFKQAMSVKRSSSSLLLKTPRTFAISYLTSNKQHPYLNKFKECALTTFNVDYTPEGQYMTYMSSNIDERSMISYVISMTFQELEPVFDDEYGSETTITNVGY
jgi:hypothetical protein